MDINKIANRIAISEVKDKDITTLENLTDKNYHTEALIHLYSKILGERGPVKALKLISDLSEYFGSTPKELGDLRYKKFYKPAMAEVNKKFDKETAQRIHKAL